MVVATSLLIVMGPSGCGKSTVGSALASTLENAIFLEGDSFHPKENVDKMSNNIPLNDDDRWPWLDAIRARITEESVTKPTLRFVILSCSALKRTYRDRLRNIESIVKTQFFFLDGSFEEIWSRMSARENHYMKADMLRSQFDTLEIPQPSVEADTVNIPIGERSNSQIVTSIVANILEAQSH